MRGGYTEEPPFAYFDEGTGRVEGESPESLRAIVKELGIEDIRWVRLDFGDLIPSLLQGRIDVVAAGIYVTPEREEVVTFSVPTVCSGPALLVPHGSTLQSIQDVAQDTTVRVVVLQGSVEDSAARELGIDESRILHAPDMTTGVVAVLEGSAEVFAITDPTAQRAIQSQPPGLLELHRYDPPPEVQAMLAGCSALAFRPDDTSLVDAANRALGAYVGSSQHRVLLARLGFRDEAIPSPRPSP